MDAHERLAAYLDGLIYEARKPVSAYVAHRAAIVNMRHDTQPTEAASAFARDIIRELGLVAVAPTLLDAVERERRNVADILPQFGTRIRWADDAAAQRLVDAVLAQVRDLKNEASPPTP